ncbi:MAG: hypothetical protein QOI36_3024 [Pseudonocardiales bacterium]|jgi:hypothetical protein|nr:hypothetical protein [Pseudonocardia sp.]MDT7651618.1 hypothetical protein [Pseudonocardiales bacterium]
MAVVAHWYCGHCDVEGRDPATEPSCWNCGGAVIVTARPSLEWTDSARAAD